MQRPHLQVRQTFLMLALSYLPKTDQVISNQQCRWWGHWGRRYNNLNRKKSDERCWCWTGFEKSQNYGVCWLIILLESGQPGKRIINVPNGMRWREVKWSNLAGRNRKMGLFDSVMTWALTASLRFFIKHSADDTTMPQVTSISIKGVFILSGLVIDRQRQAYNVGITQVWSNNLALGQRW